MNNDLKYLILGSGALAMSIYTTLHVPFGINAVLFTETDFPVLVKSELPDNYNIYLGRPYTINDKSLIKNFDVVISTYPANIVFDKINSFELNPDAILVSLTGLGGWFDKISHKKTIALQRVPFISRYEKDTGIIHIMSYKDCIRYASRGIASMELEEQIVRQLSKCNVLEKVTEFETHVTNSNPLLHSVRLYDIYQSQLIDNILSEHFYLEWTQNASHLAIEMDNELSSLYKLNSIQYTSILDHYGVKDEDELTEKIRSIESFKSILTPIKNSELDRDNRYFTEDIDVSLRYIKHYAQKNNISTPTIDMIMEWYDTVIKQ